MYKLKQSPEDFIVKEISNIEVTGKGDYSYFLLKKKNYNTLRAIENIAKSLKIPSKFIGFAGNKDKIAITEQVISIKAAGKERTERLQLKDLNLTFLGKGNKPVSLGDLTGNEFIITVRNLTKKETENLQNKIKNKKLLIPNYFGEQRFSKNNKSIGKHLIKKDFSKAIELILKNNSDYNPEINEHLSKAQNDFIGALRNIPKKLLKLYVHSYQSYLWNQTVEEYINKNGLKNITIPIIGFGTEIYDKQINEIISKIIKKENIDYRDFIIRELPELSAVGQERNMLIELTDLKIISKEKDKITLSFSLPKGCYATIVIKFLIIL